MKLKTLLLVGSATAISAISEGDNGLDIDGGPKGHLAIELIRGSPPRPVPI
jgi:hypothetical protein